MRSSLSTHISLRPVTPEDIPALYGLCCSGQNGSSWRYAGTTPSPNVFAATLWDGVAVQFKVELEGIPGIAGLLVMYDEVGNYGKVGAVFDEALHLTGLPIAAMELFLEHIFSTRSLGKLYFETSKPIIGRTAEQLLRLEGTFSEHVFVNGQWSDQYVYALSRGTWRNWTSERSSSSFRPDVPSIDGFSERLTQLLGPSRLAAPSVQLKDLDLDSLDILMVWDYIESIAPEWRNPVPVTELMSLTVAELHHLVAAFAERRIDYQGR